MNNNKKTLGKNSFSFESLEKSLAECSLSSEKRRQRFQPSEPSTQIPNYSLLSRGEYNPLLERDLKKRSYQKELYDKIHQLVSIQKIPAEKTSETCSQRKEWRERENFLSQYV